MERVNSPIGALSAETAPTMNEMMGKLLEHCSKDPVRCPAKKSFVSPHLTDWLTGHPVHSPGKHKSC